MIPVCMAAWVLIGATAYNGTFDRAVAAYEQEDFAASIEAFEQLVTEGVVSPEVFFNLGNAYRKSGKLGAAIANYERALYLNPAFESAAVNLSQCRQLTKGQFEQTALPSWDNRMRFLDGVTPSMAGAFAILSWFLFWSLLGVRKVFSLKYLRRVAGLALVLTVLSGSAAWVRSHPPLVGIINVDSVAARVATAESAQSRFTLNEGDRVLVERREAGWARIRTSDGGRGWIPDTALAFVGPPYERPTPALVLPSTESHAT